MKNMIRNTLTAIKNKWLINLISCVLLALLFVSEINLYYTLYYNAFIVQERYRSNLSDSTYSFALNESIDQKTFKAFLDSLSGDLSEYEDVVIASPISDSEEGMTREIICFYGGISLLHDFKSSLDHTRLNNSAFESGAVLGTNGLILSDNYQLNGKTYKLIQQISDLNAYVSSEEPLFCSDKEYFDFTDNVSRVIFEYKRSLSIAEYNALNKAVNDYASVTSATKPETSSERAMYTIGELSGPLMAAFIVMIIVTTCVVPIVRYCLWLRRYEFRSYRVCGADTSYITLCEVCHVCILGIISIIFGVLISCSMMAVKGFWVMMLIAIVLFILRLVTEVLIAGSGKGNVLEVNERWR